MKIKLVLLLLFGIIWDGSIGNARLWSGRRRAKNLPIGPPMYRRSGGIGNPPDGRRWSYTWVQGNPDQILQSMLGPAGAGGAKEADAKRSYGLAPNIDPGFGAGESPDWPDWGLGGPDDWLDNKFPASHGGGFGGPPVGRPGRYDFPSNNMRPMGRPTRPGMHFPSPPHGFGFEPPDNGLQPLGPPPTGGYPSDLGPPPEIPIGWRPNGRPIYAGRRGGSFGEFFNPDWF